MVLAGLRRRIVPMRGDSNEQSWMLLAITPDQKVPQDHPIRAIKPIVDRALASLSPVFSRMYAKVGRPSIPPEHLLKASLLIAFYSIRSERQFCERLEYDLLFKWFLDQNIATPAFDASTFSKNRQRLLEHDVARQFFQAVIEEARQRELLSEEHFTVDGTLLEAWASMKSVQPKDDEGGPPQRGFKNPDVDFRGEKRSNETHASRTDPEALLMRKGLGKETKLCFAGHVLMENRNGLIVDIDLTQATGRAEREAALRMLDRLPRKKRRLTLGADKGYDTRDFVQDLRQRKVTPHVTQNQNG
jgi:transposase